ncbi:MAG TPA: hypothetical protein VN437_03535, partial [Rectinemataceae bacterium]|nr:hypothetical protein [Rectinemataceae bacterium]
SKVEQLELRSKSVKDKIAALHEEEEAKEDELSDYRTRLKETDRHIEEFESSIKAAGLALRSNDEESAKCLEGIKKVEEEIATARVKLDDITEVIVQQLDARLRETGYSSPDRQSLESEIQALIERIKSRLDSKATLLADVKRSLAYEGKNAADFVSTVLKSAEDLVDTSHYLSELSEKFSFYRKMTPSFLDEFLSPEGIITQKRAIDASISLSGEKISGYKTTIDALGAENKELALRIDAYRRTLEDARLAKAKLQTQMSGAQDALAVFRREIAGQEATLREQEAEIYSETRRLAEFGEELDGIDAELAEIEAKGKKLSVEMDGLERGIALKNSDLVQRKK